MHRLPGHESEVLTDMLIDQIDRHQEESFFFISRFAATT